MFLFTRRREGRATAPILFQFLSFYLIYFHAICSAFPQRELPSNATDTSIPESPTVSVRLGGFSAHPETAHIEQTQSALGDSPTAEPTFPSRGGNPRVETTVIPPETAPVPEGPIVTPNIPRIESTAEGLDSPSSTVDATAHQEQTEPEVIPTPTCLGCSIGVTVTGLDFPTTPVAEVAGNGNGAQPTASPPPAATVTAGTAAIQINKASSGFLIGTQAVSAGQTISIQGTPIVVQTTNGQTQVIVGSSTILIYPGPTILGQITAPPRPAPLTVAGQRVTANNAGNFVIGTQTLQPGGPAITVSGTTISLAPSGSIAVINGVTSTLAPGTQATATAGPPLLTLNGHTYTANSATQYIIGPGTTLTPGGAVTISGTVVSLAPSGTGIVVGGTTSPLGEGTTAGTVGGPGATAKATHSSAGAGKTRGTGTTGWTGWIEGLVGGLGIWAFAVFL